MEKFLDRHKIPKLNWDQGDHLNRPTSSKEIKVIIEILPPKKGPDGFSAEFYQSKKSYHQYFTYSSIKYKQKEHYTPRSMKPQLC